MKTLIKDVEKRIVTAYSCKVTDIVDDHFCFDQMDKDRIYADTTLTVYYRTICKIVHRYLVCGSPVYDVKTQFGKAIEYYAYMQEKGLGRKAVLKAMAILSNLRGYSFPGKGATV